MKRGQSWCVKNLEYLKIRYCLLLLFFQSLLLIFCQFRESQMQFLGSTLCLWKERPLVKAVCFTCTLQTPHSRGILLNAAGVGAAEENVLLCCSCILSLRSLLIAVFVNSDHLASSKRWSAWWHKLDVLPLKSLDMFTRIVSKSSLVIVLLFLCSH